MAHNRPLTYACPTPILSTAPGKILNNAEANFVRLIYDSFLSVYGAAGEIHQRSAGEAFELRSFAHRMYADQESYGINEWAPNLEQAIREVSLHGQVQKFDKSILVTGVDAATLDDALRSPAAIPFRQPERATGFLDTHPATSGPYYVERADADGISLRSNPCHPAVPAIDFVRILHITHPGMLRQLFERADIDIMVVGGDEVDIHTGKILSDGILHAGPSTTISMLTARPNGVLVDDDLRLLVASAIPRDAFRKQYLGVDGRSAYGFSTGVRNDISAVPSCSTTARKWPRIVFIVPPSERTINRGRWLAGKITARTGAEIELQVPSWPDYWAALHDSRGGDLIWAGIQVELDDARYWVRYNLFGHWLPIPKHFSQLRSDVWSRDISVENLERAERSLISDGWVMPLYQHYQCYLVRAGISGFQIDDWDWPLPATQRITDLSWS
jgi:hypothetical protein